MNSSKTLPQIIFINMRGNMLLDITGEYVNFLSIEPWFFQRCTCMCIYYFYQIYLFVKLFETRNIQKQCFTMFKNVLTNGNFVYLFKNFKCIYGKQHKNIFKQGFMFLSRWALFYFLEYLNNAFRALYG